MKKGYHTFWLQADLPKKYPGLWVIVRKLLLAFSSTYCIEKSSSGITNLLTKNLSQILIIWCQFIKYIPPTKLWFLFLQLRFEGWNSPATWMQQHTETSKIFKMVNENNFGNLWYKQKKSQLRYGIYCSNRKIT